MEILTFFSSAFHKYYEISTGKKIRGWKMLRRVLMFPSRVIPVLRRLYKSYKDLDMYSTALMEKPPTRNGRRSQVLPPTHAGRKTSLKHVLPVYIQYLFLSAIAASQFARLRRADRFFYENQGPRTRFTPAQLREIKKTTLASVLCETTKLQAARTTLSELAPSC